jgi:hypothetical protein
MLSGCASHSALSRKITAPVAPEAALRESLGRFDHWTSLFARLKLHFSVHDTSFTARGHVMYLAGERYEVGFEKPYNQYLGTFYVTPNQFIYFDTHNFPTTYSLQDTVILSRLIPMGVPNWDPRDLMPFPVSGRTSGFQTDSMRSAGNLTWIYGSSDRVSYALTMKGNGGAVVEEQVQRAGRDLVIKKYDHVKNVNGWPVATRMTCTNAAGDVRFIWSISGIRLKAGDVHATESISPSK